MGPAGARVGPMAAVRTPTDPPKRLTTVVTVATMVAIVGIAYRFDRAYGRWLAEISPLTRPRARLGRMKVGYRERRADVSDLAFAIFGVMDEVDRARSERTRT